MNPTASSVHVNTPLSQISIAFMQNAQNFVADKAFPVVPVDKQSDLYYEYDRADWNRNQMAKRAPATESIGGGYRVSNTPYFADVFALHKDIDDQIRANADSAFNLDRDASEWLARMALLNREVNWATDFFTTGVWTTDWTGVSAGENNTTTFRQWNDATSIPLETIRRAKRTIKLSTGYSPNTLVIGTEVWDMLVDHVDILERIKYSSSNASPAMVTREMMSALLEIDQILVMESIQNTAIEGQASSNAFIGGKKALLIYAPTNPGLLTPAAGYTFAWRGYMGGTQPAEIQRFRLQELRSDRVEIEAAYDQKRISADLGVFFGSVVA